MKCSGATGAGGKEAPCTDRASTCAIPSVGKIQEYKSKIVSEWLSLCKPPKKEGKKDKDMQEGAGTMCRVGSKNKTRKNT